MKIEEIIFYSFGIGFILFVLFGSKTYYISIDNLKSLFANKNLNPDEKTYVKGHEALNTLLGTKMFNNQIKELQCFDKKGNQFIISINKSTQIKFVLKNGKKIQLYFDTLYLKDDCVVGSKTHITTVNVSPISIDQISEIQLQFRHSRKEKLI